MKFIILKIKIYLKNSHRESAGIAIIVDENIDKKNFDYAII